MRRLLLVCLVAACSNNNNDMMMGDDAPTPDTPPSGPVTPQVGQWFYSETTPVSSTCPASVGNGTGNFAIDQATSSSFHIVPGDGTAPFTCTLNGKAFDCPDRAAATQDLRPAVDAVLAGRAVANGNFMTSTAANGRQTLTVNCTGTQCSATGAQFPCTVIVDFVIRAR